MIRTSAVHIRPKSKFTSFVIFCHILKYLSYVSNIAMRPILKDIDEQGRIVIPAEWRKKYLRGSKVILRNRGEVLEIRPREKVDLTAFFDRAEVEIKSNLSDWHALRRELRKK
jgi:bifunctional DNA-binding transcriptional regulator/antitoxin component of YhaV-PrlF toxin-antitoxin module